MVRCGIALQPVHSQWHTARIGRDAMDSIVPCRACVTERFPVASFTVRSPVRRYYEVCCATDPELFHPDHAHRRNTRNFYSSREEGLLSAGPQATTFMIPPSQLQRFAGAQRIHYALATYGSPRGGDPRFSIAPGRLGSVPAVDVSPGFTGKSLDRRRLGYLDTAGSTYGGSAARRPLRWGGDDALEAERAFAADDDDDDDDSRDEDRYGGDTSGEPIIEVNNDDYADDGAVPMDDGAGPAPVVAAALCDDDYESDGAVPLASDSRVYGRCPPARLRGARRSVYDETDREEPLAVGPAGTALTAALDLSPLEIADKVRLLQQVAGRITGPDRYSAVAAPEDGDSPDSLGLSWGFLLFPQRSGAIGRVLDLAVAREHRGVPHTLSRIFGPAFASVRARLDAAGDLSPDARLAAVDGRRLWEEPWLSAFREAGRQPHVQAAQNELAVREVFDGMMPIARAFQLRTPKALALLLDRAVDMGVGGARAWLMQIAGPVKSQADRDVALRALGHDAGALEEFQNVRGLTADGRWGPLTHAALTGALRCLGSASPLTILGEADVVAAIEQESRATAFADRVGEISGSADFDDNVAYAIE
jgi:hypothetical protein